MNNAGQVAFHGSLTGPGVTTANERGIWSEGGGTTHLVVRTGTQGPCAPAGSDFVSFLATGLQINDRGHVAFIGHNEATQVPFTINDQGIWSDRTGVLAPIAIDKQPAPGIGGGAFLTAFREVTLNAVDQAAYIGVLEGPGVDDNNSFGVWSEALGGPRLVAREGSCRARSRRRRGLRFLRGARHESLGTNGVLRNRAGQRRHRSERQGRCGPKRIDGTLRLIVREGDTIEVAPGEMRTLQASGLSAGSAGQDGRRTGFNDRGQFVALARFTDDSAAVLIWDDVVALPGDFNADGSVDAADYTVWRNRLGSAFTAEDYQDWRANFGETIEVGSGSYRTPVPEPSSCWPITLSIAIALAAARRIRCDVF